MKMLALMKYGDKAASTRQRLLQYVPYFSRSGIEVSYSSLLSNDYLERTFQGQSAPVLSIVTAYLSRAALLLRASQFDLIWVHYECFPYMPGFFERLAELSGKPIVYDFDDAIFHQYDSHPRAVVRRFLGLKLQPLLNAASLCVCGNAYLASYAERFCRRAEIIPTVVDTTVYFPKNPASTAARPLVVGWIGSPSTWRFVLPIVPLLSRLSQELNLKIRVIGAGPQDTVPPNFEFLDWSEEAEVEMIQGMDVGIMPLPDEPWARGKCGYKLIQYMACGIPVVASPVGVNADIVDHGLNGFLASQEDEWDLSLRRLLADSGLIKEMGVRGREKVMEKYSLQAYGPRLAALLCDVAGKRLS
jgi:glycosyltransferase involved in cell wall biosynthesis